MYNDGRLEVRDLIGILIRRRKSIFITIGIFCMIAVAYDLLAPTWYESNVNLRVKYNRSVNDSIGTLSQEEIMTQQIYTYAEIVKGKTVVMEVVNKVYGDLPGEDQPDYEHMQKRIEAQPVKNTEILNVAVQGKTAEEAQALGNALVQTLLAHVSDMERSEGRETKTFIGQQLQEAKENLSKIEKEIVEYKEKNQIYAVSDQTKNLLDQQFVLRKLLVDSQLAVKNNQAKLASTNEQIREENPNFIGDSPLIQQYKGKLEDMEVDLIGLKKLYKSNHPKVESEQAAIDDLKQKMEVEIGKVARAELPSSNVIHQGVLQAKLQNEVDVAASQAQLTAMNKEMAGMDAELKDHPQKEQGLIKLLRDSAVAEQSYMDLAKSYDQARIDEVKEPTNVQVVDMPDLPEKPAKPRKLLNIAIGLLLGLFTGVTIACISETFYKTIDTAEDAVKYLGLPVIGGIPEYESEQKRTKWADNRRVNNG